jgi:hypothetical protein
MSTDLYAFVPQIETQQTELATQARRRSTTRVRQRGRWSSFSCPISLSRVRAG